ncbi:MAG: RNA-binding transcriptional accessory protein [Spirochaetales bacterium]|nr:RNA-binding transcriptional accessory protein [Spirochaetales bacterium]
METQVLEHITGKTKLRSFQVEAVVRLLDEGSTVPFIARYRKEATGELDEVQILAIRDAYAAIVELMKRKSAILSSLVERELLTDELKEAVEKADNMALLEDIYLPYRPKRRTRGMKAREAGLEALAEWLLAEGTGARFDAPAEPVYSGTVSAEELQKKAELFISSELGVNTAEEALAGARDILAEIFNENKDIRQDVRRLFTREALLTSKVISIQKDDPEAAKYRDYFAWSESAAKAPSHRILAVLRGSEEGHLISHVLPEREKAQELLETRIIGRNSPDVNAAAAAVWEAAQDSYKRLMAPSLENELWKSLKERADLEAIKVFKDNLRELLLAPPLGQKRVFALDPGLRTGCKWVCLDEKGDLKEDGVIYPLVPKREVEKSTEILRRCCKRWDIEAIAVGNGTGGREAESFARQAVEGIKTAAGNPVVVMMVNESGASVYSASQAARDEFPDYDVTVRGAVSIGRRLMDPLAELVKIDPRSIGVGQYQHDVDQDLLRQSLTDVVLSCVNSVGVEVNTASRQLLSYVSGISDRIAGAICRYRESNGVFRTRKELKKVSGLGDKTFEQAAGFLRIQGGENPLDSSAVHPESYSVVERMASDLSCTLTQLMSEAKYRKKIHIDDYVTDSVGLPTLRDIIRELEKPGRDPRESFEVFEFSDQVHEPKDLTPGMLLPGIVTNVTAFGAFVDVGVHQDGLVHISKLADRFVKDPAEVVKVNQKVQVKVLEVDLDRNRISLSMKDV